MCVHVEGGREDNQSLLVVLLVVVKFDRYKNEEIRDEKKLNIWELFSDNNRYLQCMELSENNLLKNKEVKLWGVPESQIF